MTMTYKTIVVAVDGSKEAEWAFKKAIQIAKRNNAKLILSHIIDLRGFATVEIHDHTVVERSEQYAKELLSGYQQQALAAGLNDVVIDIEFGSPKVKIAKEVAPKYKADLIICGATGLNAMERLLIGSVSEHITRYAKCDVLVVRTEKE
ncbi:universal stress protein [Saccharococcus caldoxylosilyticus]|jgi:nucleotide-binding universal stress UspA family protein|uniref:Universal stress protein n=2 Tax=Saccharococcus caldoxylosilyticus TaxID=81408 RepID=A0A023DCX9_9BACL|nr:universal stress protein [Parageobacillus caldoxylosilyticus]OQP03894.1 universal stress protein UspA [Geobacillus sp. 44B]MBB3851999.1 nucleotide-binding universal stress UspA family protein [Parageobacillus caldoxylosilyticus]QNU39345.1 universal stress protein [Geobacillus sp. 44B]QXJ39209.1 Putative universal stress protein [Parageobacillus caldoxylosilyticus]BDG37102.1 universal stress protein [Parageobacillus caldoxylosilyticus]